MSNLTQKIKTPKVRTPKATTPKRAHTPKSRRSSRSIRSSRSKRSKIVLAVEEEPFYHGLLPREDVKTMLCKEGEFLVRHTEVRGEKTYVASVLTDGQVRHLVIKETKDEPCQYVIETDRFDSIGELMRHHKTKPVTIANKEIHFRTPVPKADWELRHDQIKLEEKLGEGAFGEVHRGILYLSGKKSVPVAVKSSRLSGLNKAEIAEMMKETRLMRQYDHPNVVKFYGVAAEQEPILIVMELVSGGGLNKYVQKKADSLTTEQLTKLCSDAAKGLKYLHEHSCVHRDVAARNCLIGDDGTVKIADFGLSIEGDSYKSNKKKKVPIKWLSPETLCSQIYTSKSDVWSYGVLMWEIFAFGVEPYTGMPSAEVQKEVRAGYRMSAPEAMPEQLRLIMNKCWKENPDQRPTFEQIVSDLTA